MIKAVIFDVDGVLIDLTIAKAKDQFEKDWGITSSQTQAFFMHDFINCLKGEADLKETIAPYLVKWGWNSSVNEFLDYWFESQKTINNEVIDVVNKLKKRSLKVFVATNQEKYRAEYLSNKLGFGMLFDGFYASSSIGTTKKDPEFFIRLLEQIQMKPANVLFWDDTMSHVESAKSIGMNAELFTNTQEFKNKLETYLQSPK